MKSERGFTLIEVLAIIVIIAIISLITIPGILNIIEKSKKGAVTDSAYGYINSVNKLYVSKSMSDPSYNISDDCYEISDLKTMGVNVKGSSPVGESWIGIINNEAKYGCLQFGDYTVDIIDGVVGEVLKGTCESKPTLGPNYIAPTESDTHMGIVYLNVNDAEALCYSGVEGKNRNQDGTLTGIKSGCMKFYIYNENEDGTVDMILDHNTSVKLKWARWWNYDGPKEALYQLYEDTKDWGGVSDLTQSSNYTPELMCRTAHYIIEDYETGAYTTEYTVHDPYTVDYTKHLSSAFEQVAGAHKARFMTAEEVMDIIGKDNWSLGFGMLVYFDSKDVSGRRSASNPSNYAWLYDNLNDCKQYGCKNQDIIYFLGNNSYWTSSPLTSDNDSCRSAYQVSTINGIAAVDVEINNAGVRPVITVSKDLLGIE